MNRHSGCSKLSMDNIELKTKLAFLIFEVMVNKNV